ncbi:cytochrome P450 [Suillus subalutaceus]|uniref:cytochrome P450 n=1 Tax=Suillus subalutaceus TaxID=48586 RepID=UPI001B8806A3|nr:cytochrome P450 [Suillus subalutaceus]KAG1840821.1 cytochrome P450 [Suillus subalutaceus]
MSLRFTGSTQSNMATLTVVTLLYVCLAGVGVYLMMQVFVKKNHAPYPPGPRGLPLVGNIQDIPHVKPWLTFAEWGKKYGDISHVNVLGQHIFVLNSVKTAVEMLDKKSSIYSDRPVVPMSGELMGYKQTLPYLRYVALPWLSITPWRRFETRRFLERTLAKPDSLQTHIRLTIAAISLRICYGYEVKEDNDPLINIGQRALDQFSRYGLYGDFIVDFLPSLARLPEWFPGAGFKRLARECRETIEEVAAVSYKYVKDQMAAGTAPKSFSSDLLKDHTLTAEEDHIVKWSAVSLSGGADTTVSAIYSFFLAMTLFPDVQKKAQAEIDTVVGPDRLPSFSDRPSLPYIEALAKEVLRWNVAIPSIDHSTTEDDIHDGYYIPKGSLIIPNMWFMLNDPKTYANPSEFNPERFLGKDGKEPEPDPRTTVRIESPLYSECNAKVLLHRICPGLHLADASIWIFTAMSLAVFDVSKVVENGVEIIPEIDPSSGLVSHPKPFKCSIKARSDKALALIQQDTS